MKHLTPLMTALVAASLSACASGPAPAAGDAEASSAAPEAADATPRRSARGHSKDAFFAKYDVDGDGQVTEAEFMAERAKGYLRRDADADGNVYSEEYVSEYEVRLLAEQEDQRKRQIDQAEFRFTVLDTDKDGVLSLEEFHASGRRMFSTLDTDQNGIIDDQDSKENY